MSKGWKLIVSNQKDTITVAAVAAVGDQLQVTQTTISSFSSFVSALSLNTITDTPVVWPRFLNSFSRPKDLLGCFGNDG